MAVPSALLAEATAMAPELTELRRRLHRIPEIGLDLPMTQAAVLEALEGLGLEVTTGEALSSVVAVLRGGRPGPVVLLRGDMDALPVTEESAEPVRSEHEGVMHACGHDLHMAGLVGAARLLAARREEIAGSVVFMFQPGEEGVHGARLMLEEGLLDAAGERVAAAYGLHVFAAQVPSGVVTARAGTVFAAVDTLHVTRARARRARLGAARRPRPGAGRGGDRPGAAGRGDPPVLDLRPGGGHGRQDLGRHEGQHHPGDRAPRRDGAHLLPHDPRRDRGQAAARGRARRRRARAHRRGGVGGGVPDHAERRRGDRARRARHQGPAGRRTAGRRWSTRWPARRTSPTCSRRSRAPT